MKKIALTLTMIFLVAQLSTAQESKFFNSGKMIVGAQTGFSALGLGYGANFEFGITKNIGILPSFILHSYSTGMVDWSFKVADLYGTYHYVPKDGFLFITPDKMDAYAMLGISWVSFGAKSGSTSEETASNIAFGGGAGTRYYINNKISIYAEGKYRVATFKTQSYSLAIGWYSIYAGVNFAIN